MNRTNIFLLLLITALLGVGCSATGGTGAYNAEDILETVRKSYQSTPDLNLKGDMKISGMPITIWFDAVIKQYDSLKLVMNGPFGMPVGSMTATPDHFVFVNLQQNIAYEGAPTAETFQELMTMQMGYNEMVAMLRGEVPNFPLSGTYSVKEEGGDLVYSHTKGSSVESFRINPGMPALVAYERSYDTGDTTLSQIRIEYDKHNKVGDRYFAKKATVTIAEGDRTLRIAFDRIVGSVDPAESCTIKIPPGMERERL